MIQYYCIQPAAILRTLSSKLLKYENIMIFIPRASKVAGNKILLTSLFKIEFYSTNAIDSRVTQHKFLIKRKSFLKST